MNEIISFKNVSKKYLVGNKEVTVLNDITFSINKGEFVVILGPSGSGKSTLLNLIGGIDRVNSGDIYINGNNIVKYNEKKLTSYRACDIGFVFQSYNLIPSLTILENIKVIDDIINRKSDANLILKQVGLEHEANKFPNELSGGEQQRISIARALAKEPTILLCDEPTGALDTKNGVEILKLLKEHNEKNNTIIIVTHNELISQIASRIIKIKNGKIVENNLNKHPKQIDEVLW